MRTRILPLTAVLIFVFALAFSFAAVSQEAAAARCENCWVPCPCHAWDEEGGRLVPNGQGGYRCDVFYCGNCDDPCY
jgi:hypothetical protein